MRFSENTRHDSSKVLRLPRKVTMEVAKVLRLCHEKCDASFENVAKVLRLPHKTTFDTSLKHVGMSRSATPATQNDMTTSSDTSKESLFATFPIGTATLRPRRPQTDGCERLRTVAYGCEWVRTPEAGSGEHGSTPRPPNVKREPFATHSGKFPKQFRTQSKVHVPFSLAAQWRWQTLGLFTTSEQHSLVIRGTTDCQKSCHHVLPWMWNSCLTLESISWALEWAFLSPMIYFWRESAGCAVVPIWSCATVLPPPSDPCRMAKTSHYCISSIVYYLLLIYSHPQVDRIWYIFNPDFF